MPGPDQPSKQASRARGFTDFFFSGLAKRGCGYQAMAGWKRKLWMSGNGGWRWLEAPEKLLSSEACTSHCNTLQYKGTRATASSLSPSTCLKIPRCYRFLLQFHVPACSSHLCRLSSAPRPHWDTASGHKGEHPWLCGDSERKNKQRFNQKKDMNLLVSRALCAFLSESNMKTQAMSMQDGGKTAGQDCTICTHWILLPPGLAALSTRALGIHWLIKCSSSSYMIQKYKEYVGMCSRCTMVLPEKPNTLGDNRNFNVPVHLESHSRLCG